MNVITSKDNSKVKYLVSLHDRKTAAKAGVVFVEGVRICEDAIKSGVEVITAIADEKHASWAQDIATKSGADLLILNDVCFKKISSTVNPQGVALVVKRPESLKGIPLRGDGKDIFLCLEDIQDPGNLGTMIRLADAFDFGAVIVTKNTADRYNEKVIRSSMGSVWHVPVIECETSRDIIEMLHNQGIQLIAAELHGDSLSKANIELPAAYFIGNEGNGLKQETIDSCDFKVKIEMQGRAESLNAAAAASIIGYKLQEER
ncbi:MAG: RNA methyltransferase [Saccharofermentans sp.]|nr:RNA methyltransferase [Saccharofermentans sp.]